MQTGISTACLFPMLTEKSLLALLKNNIKTFELFLNSPCESNCQFAKSLLPILNEYDAKIVSVHPCSSEFEGVNFFGRYIRRFYDSLDNYKNLFDICNLLDAEILVFHGARKQFKIPNELYFERFAKLWEAAKAQNVYICQENVVNFYSGDCDFVEKMIKELPFATTVLDIKQCIRANESPIAMLKAMGKNLKHVHLSDNNKFENCMPPGKGTFDMKNFINELRKLNYDGKLIIELYRQNFGEIEELCKSKEIIDRLLCIL